MVPFLKKYLSFHCIFDHKSNALLFILPKPFYYHYVQLHWLYQHHHQELHHRHQGSCNQHLRPRHRRKHKGKPTRKGLERQEGQLKEYRPMMYPKPKTSYKSSSSNSSNTIITIVTVLIQTLFHLSPPLRRLLLPLHKYNHHHHLLPQTMIWNGIPLFPRILM